MMTRMLLLLGLPCAGWAQDSLAPPPVSPIHTVFAGLNLPLAYSAGYRCQFTRRLSAQLEGQLLTAPFERYTLKTLAVLGLDPGLSGALSRSVRQGRALSIGVNLHARTAWYAGAFGQYLHLNAGPITPADALGVYFKRDLSGFGLLDSPAFNLTLQSTLWLAGLRVGHSIRWAGSRLGVNLEASLGKIVATRNSLSSNRPLIDDLAPTRRLYASLDEDLDAALRRTGFLPTLNGLLTYRLGGAK